MNGEILKETDLDKGGRPTEDNQSSDSTSLPKPVSLCNRFSSECDRVQRQFEEADKRKRSILAAKNIRDEIKTSASTRAIHDTDGLGMVYHDYL
jgi:hypothetical protein